MRINRFILLAILGFASVCRGDPTNTFAIYLTAEPVDSGIFYGKGDWSSLKLQATPLISETDIVAYDFTNHWMTLKPEVFKQLQPLAGSPGSPFVVIANGKRIYLGAFVGVTSSIPVPVPSIVPMGRHWYTNLPPDTVQIDRAWGWAPDPPRKLPEPDPRPDDRIKRALATLQKLK